MAYLTAKEANELGRKVAFPTPPEEELRCTMEDLLKIVEDSANEGYFHAYGHLIGHKLADTVANKLQELGFVTSMVDTTVDNNTPAHRRSFCLTITW